MRLSKAVVCGGLILAGATQANAGSVDAKLLDMLKANGSISAAQHAELSADLAREAREEKRAAKDVVKEKDFVAFRQAAGWAESTKLTGDMRVRQETIDVDGEPDFTGSRDKDRQRIRARLGAFTKVNPKWKPASRSQAATAPTAARPTRTWTTTSTRKRCGWISPTSVTSLSAVPGLKTFAGKMKQPWMAMGDVIWDGDINPEGFAAGYTKKNGTTTFFGSGGYYTLKDAVDSEGFEIDNDLGLYQAQVGVAFDVTDAARWTLGASIYDFNNDKYGSASSFRANGNTTDQFGLGEIFTQLDVIGLPLPLSLYGQYVQNYEARDFLAFEDGGEDTAFLVGLRTNVAGIAFDYNYRDVEANAVVGGFTDSDFAVGFTNSSGHKFKLKYDFMKNFSIGATYFMAESDAVSSQKLQDADADTIHVDLEAKF